MELDDTDPSSDRGAKRRLELEENSNLQKEDIDENLWL
jgi:hypothetical protein